jgi:hypothetical protein
MTMMVKEKLQDFLSGMRDVYLKDRRTAAMGINKNADKINLCDHEYLESLVTRCVCVCARARACACCK